jgi:hypothetical protein
MLYSINYDLKKQGKDYKGLHEAIKSCGVWWHYLGSTWLVDTSLNAAGIFNKVKSHIDADDNILIIGVTKDSSGWLPQAAWEWINSRRSSAA